jgi:ribosomal protein L11 methylase PrmA
MIWIYAAAVIILIFGMVVFRGAPYVPSHRKFVRMAFSDLYKVTKKDVLIDIGSGDGIILRIAAAQGAKAIGYEINPILVVISKLLARGNPRISTKLADFWLTELPQDTTIVYAFAVTRDIEKIAKKMQKTANSTGHQVWLMTYGAPVRSREPVRTLHAHSLYLFEPLQSDKA